MKSKIYFLISIGVDTCDSTPKNAVLEDLYVNSTIDEDNIVISIDGNCPLHLSNSKVIEFGDKETILAELV